MDCKSGRHATQIFQSHRYRDRLVDPKSDRGRWRDPQARGLGFDTGGEWQLDHVQTGPWVVRSKLDGPLMASEQAWAEPHGDWRGALEKGPRVAGRGGRLRGLRTGASRAGRQSRR